MIASANTIPWRRMRRRPLDEWQPPARLWREAAFLGWLPSLILCLVAWLTDQLSDGWVEGACLQYVGVNLRQAFFALPLAGAVIGVFGHIVAKSRRVWPLVESEASDGGMFHAAFKLASLTASADTQPPRVAPPPGILVLLREWLGTGAAIFLVGMGAAALTAWRHYHEGLPLLGAAEDVLIAALGISAALMWRLRRNRFDPRVWRFRLPEWALILADEHVLPHVRKEMKARIQASSVLGADLVLADDLAGFLMPLQADLPEAWREVGVNVAGDSLLRMRALVRSTSGRFYEQKKYCGVRAMLDLYRGPVHGAGLLECKRLVAQIVSRARTEKWHGLKFAGHLLAFVQRHILYQQDESTTGYREYGRFPLQTLMDQEGDCECKAILCCALLSWCGFECALILSKDHAWCGLLRPDADLAWWERFFTRRHARAYWFGETTADDGGRWTEPDDDALNRVQTIVVTPALPLTGGQMIEELVF